MKLLERDAPLRVARDVIERARQGSGSTLLVSGEAGIGKTSLIEQLLAGLAHGQRVFRGGCEDLLSPRPLGPLTDIARAHALPLRTLTEAGPAEAVFSGFLGLLGAGRSASVVVFEDVHWADQATLDLIKYLARRIASLPVLLLLSFRDDELGPEHPLRHVLRDLPPWSVARIALQPLSATAVAELAAAAGRSDAGLLEATGGNPFFVTEVLASGLVDAQRGVPSTVRDAVHRRLARMSPAKREALETLCVMPGKVELGLVRALLPHHMQAVDACLLRGVLVAADGALAFRHELARRALLDALPLACRQAKHARVLEVVSVPSPAFAPPPLTLLVHHAAEAGHAASVLELAPRAAREAAAVGAHREAAQHLEAALRFARSAPPALRAQLYESWSYEAGLSLAIDAQVIDARHQAITLWQQVGRIDKVGLNLRWLSRLHWYQGQSVLAERYAAQAVETLEPLPLGPELAWAYSVRSQFYMLQDRTDLAVEWGERACALAERLGENEILCHALNNVGTAEMFAGRPGGRAKVERSLALALAGGFHEQAARAYTNISEHAVVFKDYARAEHWLSDGIAFDRRHDLDAWTHYLVGWQAQLRLEQGRLEDAERIAGEVLAIPRLTAVMRLPAMTVLARVHMRRGEGDAAALLDEALRIALPTGEVQRITPVVAAMAEAAWLRGDAPACLDALRHLERQPGAGVNAWEAGEIAAWRQRAGQPAPAVPPHAAVPWRLELEGQPLAAAQAWLGLGAPNEAALALLQAACSGPRAGAGGALAQALEIAESIGARLIAGRVQALAREWELTAEMPRRKRRPRFVTRSAAHQGRSLSPREQQVLGHLAHGCNDAEIALQLGVALRTAEHHVAAVLNKLSAPNRAQAVRAARACGLLPASTP